MPKKADASLTPRRNVSSHGFAERGPEPWDGPLARTPARAGGLRDGRNAQGAYKEVRQDVPQISNSLQLESAQSPCDRARLNVGPMPAVVCHGLSWYKMVRN